MYLKKIKTRSSLNGKFRPTKLTAEWKCVIFYTSDKYVAEYGK